MSARGDDRYYKVAYTRRDDGRIPRHRTRRYYDYDYDYPMDAPSSRVEVDRREYASDTREYPPPSSAAMSKTTYHVGRDRNSEAYVKRTNALVIDAPKNHDRYQYEVFRPDRPKDHDRYQYEVFRPEKRDDGTYVVDLDAIRSRGYVEYDQPAADPRTLVAYESHYGGGRANRATYRDVEIIEDTVINDDDTRSRRRGRSPDMRIDDVAAAAAPRRMRSSMRGRNDSPPELVERRRRDRSVGFYRDQVSHHDASESRHERPGAEAHLAGRYLVGNSQYHDYDQGARSRSRSRGGYGPQRSDPRLVDDYDMDDDRRTHTEETLRRYEYEDEQRPAYPPQRSHRRHRRDDDDDRSSYSEYETRVKTRKDYY